ncbi:hypothetical protein TrVE_jg7869 [Triparma verrucosa]|uniref:Kinesin motor domain-containing protein n=1 Tax=Triparma verrucosa TaxID=1606542 RepID=A0A9W7BEB1_9STRA|nr:hypothetical protein TrVE_jg7869 [Triparma verrucosa]
MSDQATPSGPPPPSSSVRVSVRVRSSGSYAEAHRPSLTVFEQQRSITVGRQNPNPASGSQVRQFTYDSVLPPTSTQSETYQTVGAGMVPYVLDGYNATVLAYGQTGSGKTYTMGSASGSEDGMIPRFLEDLFKGMEEEGNFRCYATFLEVYGEDVVDLLSPSRASSSLPLREDNDGVNVVGLSRRSVNGKEAALQALKDGTVNRTTSATLMNSCSSRSHAVYSLIVTKLSQDSKTEVRKSKLTFVDLAGSERMKKTGASGETMKEGIQINVGLLALGNVINSLGLGKSHVPYRQSKLTRLLSDALGGNSMTHFVACVSPREEDVFETVSTLKYANRARDIVNAPIRGGDSENSEEVKRLEIMRQGLKCELVDVHQDFGKGWGNEKEWEDSVLKYLRGVEERAIKEFGGESKIAWSAASAISSSSGPMAPSSFSSKHKSNLNSEPFELEGDPEDDIKIIDQLLELQSEEEKYSKEEGLTKEELGKVSEEIESREKLLTKLRGNVVVYKNIKGKYTELLQEVESLEGEKTALAKQLEDAASNPLSTGGRNSAAAIKAKLQLVEDSLHRARSETRKQQQLCKAAEKEANKAKNMENVVERLKASKTNLIKKQKQAAASHRSYTESKSREIERLKKREKAATNDASKHKKECAKHVKALERRKDYCDKVRSKLKTTEQHLMRLLKMRRKELDRKGQNKAKAASSAQSASSTAKGQEIKAIKYLLEDAVSRRIEGEEMREAYERTVQEYGSLMRGLVAAVNDINENGGDEETERDVEEIEMRLEIVGADMEELRDKLGEELDNDDESSNNKFDSKTLQVVKDMVPDTARTVVLEMMESLAKTEKSKRAFQKDADSYVIRSNELEKENVQLKEQVEGLAATKGGSQMGALETAELNSVKKELSDMEKKYQAMALELAEAKEKLSVVNVTKDVKKETANALAQLQTYWRLLGVEPEERELARLELENCVERKCGELLKDATKREHDTRQEIQELNSVNETMRRALGREREEGGASAANKQPARLSLLKQKEEANKIFEEMEPLFIRAKARREKIHNDANDLLSSLERSKEEVSDKLKKFLKKSESEDGVLQEDLLASCETELRKMRVVKSELLVKSNSAYEKANRLAAETHSSSEELFQLAMSLTSNDPKKLIWFSPELCRQACDFVSSNNVRVPTNKLFGKHLELVAEGLETIAEGRDEFATALKDVIEGAHRQLMEVVETEGDATEAYASFHDALFRLPRLSEEHIKACVNEMKELSGAAEVMIQSETEALTVVWDALEMSEEVRGDFWENYGEIVKKFKAENEIEGTQFDGLHKAEKHSEQWLAPFLEQAKSHGKDLKARLFKLTLIHGEVDKNRGKQDAKNRIMSLDSEIRVIDARLAAFEEKASNKARLVSKKTNSGILLREEKFRKHKKLSFISKLEKLKAELRDWEAREEHAFDVSVLSEEVRAMMSGGGQDDDRTAFMHLRTTSSRRSMMPAVGGGVGGGAKLDASNFGIQRSQTWDLGDSNVVVKNEKENTKTREVTMTSVSAAVAAASANVDALLSQPPPPPKAKRQTRAASLAIYKSNKEKDLEKEKGEKEGGKGAKKAKPAKTIKREAAKANPFGNLLNTPTK